MIALGYIEQFFILFFVTSIHEMAHVLIAYLCGLKIAKIILLPIGEVAVLRDLDHTKPLCRFLIVGAGPMINIFIGLLLYLFISPKTPQLYFFMMTNLIIGFFNLLPIYPLDGGRIFYFFLSNRFGILRSNKAIQKISRSMSIVICFVGLIQIIFYPFNCSLLSIGIYLYAIHEKEYMYLFYGFYKNLSLKQKKLQTQKLVPTKTIVAYKNTLIHHIAKELSWDYYHLIFVIDEKGHIIDHITESQLCEYLLLGHMHDSLEACISYIAQKII